MKTKYEVFQFFLAAGAIADVVIDRNIDKRYKKVTDIFMMTSPVIADNTNLNFAKDLRIDDEIVFPQDFDSFMLYPIMQNKEFTKLREPIEIHNSKIEGNLKSVANIAANCYLKIILKVEE